VSAPEEYPGRGRVLVLGLDSAVNTSVVEPLVARGVDAQGFTRPHEAIDRFDARDFDLIVFGRGVLGPLSERLKRAFTAENPGVRFIDVIAPLAVEQTLAALAHDPRVPQFVSDVEVFTDSRAVRVTSTILAPCLLAFSVFRAEDGKLATEELGETRAEPGPFSWTGPASCLESANSLLLTAAGTEYHLHPFLSSAHERPSTPSDS
jgi:hypothetical protein